MFQILSKNKKIYISTIFIGIIFVYIVDIQLYFNNSTRLEKKMLYFPSATTDSEFFPELHNIPLVSPLSTQKSINNSSLEVFVKELFLGPQSIYNENPIRNYMRLQSVLYSHYNNRDRAFIFINFEENIKKADRDIDNEKIQEIKQWLLFNIKNYYDIDTITIFIDNIPI